MSDRKRKISIRKIIQTLVTIIVVAGFTMAIISADRLQNHKKVRSVTVQIRNKNVVHFLDEAEVMKLLFDDRHLNPKNTTLGALDIHKMEHIIRSNPWVSDAQVYVDNERNMQVFVTQRVPVARIFEENNNSYYLDTALQAMPVSDKYVHYTPLVTGAPAMHNDSNSTVLKGKILSLVNYVTRHKFWNAQIAQIVMTPDYNFELIPVLGKQRILLGDTDMLDTKLNNLLAFYTQVQNKVGWEKYEIIDLRYNGQVVASPALKWKAPVDRALSNMNWVKAVMEAGPKNEKDESVANNSDSAGRPVQVPAAVSVAATPVAAAAPPAAAPAKPKPAQHTIAQKPVPKPGIKLAAKPAAKPAKVAAKPAKPTAKDKKKTTTAQKPTKPAAAGKPKPKQAGNRTAQHN